MKLGEREMKLGEREIGPDHPPLIIAELGISDEGDVERALSNITEAYRRGAECVKQQIHVPLSAEMEPGHPWWKTLERCALSVEELHRCKLHAEALGMVWLCTPFSVEGVRHLERMDVVAYKIGSGEAAHAPLIHAMCDAGKPVIVSLGMRRASHSRALARRGALLLDCVSAYPASLDSISIDRVAYSPGRVDGWSDHTGGIAASLAMIAHGAQVVEIHVPREGPDAAASVTWDEFERLVRLAPDVWRTVQTPTEAPDDAETRRMCRRGADGRRVA